ncbi:hypothetical protein KQI42_17580 [Tissierella sp. MSJ-40]|uniref:Metallophosphoesterase n=1 Tax=Tissierella simiarum TaxID=2841534 RepID=A0ABS6EA85_9FIRM|nr:hypothetical protein [Tissierella simiarum]MBU5439831.1 hypothetical protein [Tissierella simiarum]
MGVINQMSGKAHRIRKNAARPVISTIYSVSDVHLGFWGFRKLPSESPRTLVLERFDATASKSFKQYVLFE